MTRLFEKRWFHYIFSFFITLMALWLQYHVTYTARVPAVGLLYPSSFLVAWFFGIGPGLLAVAVGTLGADFVLYEPRFDLKILAVDDMMRLAIFFVTSLAAAYVVSRGRNAQANFIESLRKQREITAQRDESLEVIETVNRVGKNLSGELDTEKLVQNVTDAATQLSRAQFGAFFYNVVNEKGEAYTLYTISGVPRESFEKFPMPRNTEIFAPTFNGEGIVRSDDITQDPRYGRNTPNHGMPVGHLPVLSYLAVPVVSRSGEVIGGLFFGHSKKGVFTEREERIVAGLASQAAIAMDNARLFEKANQAVKIRDEFLSISSHELRTPLTPLKLQLQGMAKHLEKGTLRDLPDERLRRMIVTSEKQVSRITALIEDLLDVSRIGSGKLKLNFERVDLVEIVREIVERYQPQLSGAKCDVVLHTDTGLIAEVDQLRFEQVLINFLTNSMRYAPGKPIDVSLSQQGDQAILEVKDRGIGISKQDQARIFDRFERVLSTSNYGGLGLGLFIVHQIVNAHGGTIAVESEVGAGATFTAKLPIHQLEGARFVTV